jgi:hypothetical protein
MTVKEISKGEFAAVFGQDEVREGNFAYYLTMDRMGVRKDLRTDTVEIIGAGYEEIHEEQLEKDILNTVCGDFKAYELGSTNRPFWEWEEEAKPNLFLYYLPQIGIVTFLLLIIVFYFVFKNV